MELSQCVADCLNQYPIEKKSIVFDFLRLMTKECLKRYNDVKNKTIVDVVYTSTVCRYISEALIEFTLFDKNESYLSYSALVAQKDLIEFYYTQGNQLAFEIKTVQNIFDDSTINFEEKMNKMKGNIGHLFNNQLDWTKYPGLNNDFVKNEFLKRGFSSSSKSDLG